ncbi:vegetative cell wall protein gp1-like [Trichoplusia ni]|uniref:Vegetative cell wall protein gp1-like n=1 Tax=Trichoplusia ni TaxID=7111 RepID=A0A7E5X2E1_TRINI|nr:vegetative cell wall protein gp1-like [Trichoplusia ni]
MHRAKGLTPFEMVLAVIPRSADTKAIFQIKTVCHLSGITVEAPHKRGPPGQCHNCQLYGHASKYCKARARCVKCLGDHATASCPRPKVPLPDSEPPSCVLCGEQGHPANYRGCPKAPKSRPSQPSKPNKGQKRASTRPSAPAPPTAQTSLRPQRPSFWDKLGDPSAFPPLAPQASKAPSAPRIPSLMGLQIPPHAPQASVVPPLLGLNIPPPASQPQRAPSAPRPTPPATQPTSEMKLTRALIEVLDGELMEVMSQRLSASRSPQEALGIFSEIRNLISTLNSFSRAGH